ncbi:hypothetical protein T484DRAFT_1868348 [Baffinella frigidus]|nr:hypothetical protein T484DRAFT_1868348 [Cryptophyta sp. CCMP2293]
MGCGSSTPQAESPAHVPAVTVIDATKPGNGLQHVVAQFGASDTHAVRVQASPPSCSQNGGDGHQNGHKGEDGHHHHQRLKSHLAMAREGYNPH